MVTLGLLGTGGFVISLFVSAPDPGVTLENYRRLRVGMTEAQANAILGGPAEKFPIPLMGEELRPTIYKLWHKDGLYVILRFAVPEADGGLLMGYLWQDAGNEDFTTLQESLSEGDSWIDRVRRLLPW
jgi:hypothetical protein